MKTQDRKRGPYAKSAQRRRQIIEAAFDVFAARGYQGGSLQEVADRVGLGHTAEGFIACIEASAQLLAQHIPKTQPRNQLPNRLVML